MTGPGEPRLVAFDLDGTLLDRNGQVPPRTRAALDLLRDRGVRCVLASGRNPLGMIRLCTELGLDGPQIAMQGALLISPISGEILTAWRLDGARVREHLAFAREIAANALLCFPDGFKAERLTPEVEALFLPFEEPLPEIVPSLDELADRGPIKTFVATAPGRHEESWQAARTRFAGRSAVTTGDEHSLELLPLGANKGLALRTLAEHLGIPLAQVAAVGDARNDIEMLQVAGRSAAMAQARPEVRAAAGLVVPSNHEEGVLVALDAFFPSLGLIRPVAPPSGGRPATMED